MKISFFGLGYVGLASAACIADKGFLTTCYDKDKKKLDLIQAGEPPFYEPGLKEILERVIRERRLRCTTNPKEAVRESDVTFIAVGTPSRQDGSIDLSQVKDAAKAIGTALAEKKAPHLTVVKSTVVPGATMNLVKPTLEKYSSKKAGIHFSLCTNPEFLREGSAIEDTVHPDRIIIGELDQASGDALQSLFQDFHDPMPPLIRTTPTNAELIKYANNAFLATKISFINMIANLCEKLPQADVTQVADGIGLDKRIGRLFLNAGPGWGGSCFRKDLMAIRAHAKHLATPLPLVESTLAINNKQPLRMVRLAKEVLKNLRGKKIAVLGLSFKPDTTDMRDAVSIPIIRRLLSEGAQVIAYDPATSKTASTIFGKKITYAPSFRECLRNADCALILTEWDEFKSLAPSDFTGLMKNPVVIDGRRIYNPNQFKEALTFKAIGLGP